MKQKFIYIVNSGIVDYAEPHSGTWFDEVKRFNTKKEAIECYNSIKRLTDCIAYWSVTDIRRVKIEDIKKYDEPGFEPEYEILCEFYQPQKYHKKFFATQKAFEEK